MRVQLEDGRIFENPLLCGVCQSLLGYGAMGFAEADEQREFAVRTIENHLADLFGTS